MQNISFNTHHAPVGAFASFTLGFPGATGGLASFLGKPADQHVYIGLETHTADVFEALPFYGEAADERARYDLERTYAQAEPRVRVLPFAREAITRDCKVATDTWTAGDLTFRVLSPVRSVPDPATATDEDLKQVLCPAVLVEFTVDNRAGAIPRRAFFGYQGNDPYTGIRLLDWENPELCGIGQGGITAIAARPDAQVTAGQWYTIDEVVSPSNTDAPRRGIRALGAVVMTTPPGEMRTFRLAVCFYQGGVVTSGMASTLWYTRYFANIDEVAAYALDHFDTYRQWAAEADAWIDEATHLSNDQRFMLAHAIRGYYANTEFLDVAGEPMWVVNEGEYRIINTMDLTVDQLFYELRMNPWTVRNELEWFLRRYSYTDTVRFPGDDTEYLGGLSFTHDMGVANLFTPQGMSGYESPGTAWCLSYMTHEELINWTACALTYVHQTDDAHWTQQMLPTFAACLASIVNRDHPDQAHRNGIMGLDSARCQGGAEITTYDSLDVSLGQARNNVYLAVKTWAMYVGLESLFTRQERADLAALAGEQAERCAATLVAHITPGGYIPAVLEGGNDSKIIPAIEGLVFPYVTGNRDALDPQGRFGALIRALKTHFTTVLVPGICVFSDGGWKLSFTSDNSWLSKIYLCQFVARQVFGLPWDENGTRADAAHVAWLTHSERSYWAWSDQIIAGRIEGSKYYPRGVTSILWLDEAQHEKE